MGLFSFKSKEKNDQEGVISEPDEILAYLDELVKKKSDIELAISSRTIRAKIFFLEEKNGLMRVQGEGVASFMKGKRVTCGFSLDRSWFSMKATVLVKDGKTYMELPKEIHHDERRKHGRAAFSAREQVKITILENLGQGTGVFGRAVEVSKGGMSLIVDKAMVLENEKEIGPGPGLYKPGTPLMLVKVNRIPGTSPFECQGVVKRVFKDGRWKLAIALVKVPSAAEVQIEKFVESRSIPFKLVRRTRRKREEEEEIFPPASTDRPIGGLDSKPSEKPEAQTEKPVADMAIKTVEPNSSSPEPSPDTTGENQSIAPQLSSEETAGKPESSEPKPDLLNEPAPKVAAEQVPEEERPLVYSFGRELVPFLLFLKKRTRWHAEDRFEVLVKKLNEKRPSTIIFHEQAGGKETLALIKKLNTIGLLDGVQVYWAHMGPLGPKMHVRLRMAGVERTLQFPVKDKAGLVDTIYQIGK